MKTKRILSLIMAVVMMFSAVALCVSCTDDAQSGKKDGKYTVGIIQLVTHPALDAATEGFMQALKDKLGEDKVVHFIERVGIERNVPAPFQIIKYVCHFSYCI